KDIEASGYMISINPAVKMQRKHQAVVRNAPLSTMLTESDGPYEYRGMKLNPAMVREVVGVIASIKGIEENIVQNHVLRNAEKLFKL
ncbi:MAG TPA: TatD family deoxyribonuclease, partial [Pyrodictium sp.]|nr:TatD family deoxyribonuclease [Pyrodictium sp.]